MNLLDIQQDPALFREAILIDTAKGPTPLHDVLEPWQSNDFQALDKGWQRGIGMEVEGPVQRAWLERPRGHSKTADIAIMASWALFAARKPISLIGCAADLEQARLLRDAIGRLVYINPWLSKLLEVQNNRVVNSHTGSTLDIIPSDAKSSYGLTPDGIICDEIVHWRNRDLWDSMLSASAKRSNCMMVVITNAGLTSDWQWKTREAIRERSEWHFSRLEGPKASWITPEVLDEQRALLPIIAFDRLWLNVWSSGGADWLSEDLINAAFLPELEPQERAKSGFVYVAGVDLGVKRDCSAICVLGVRRTYAGHGRIRLAYTRIWRPTPGNPVNIQEVEDTIRVLHDRFGFQQLNYDPWQAMHLAQKLQAGGLGRIVRGGKRTASLPMVEVPASSKTLQAIASIMIEAFNDRRVELYDEPNLKRDLHNLRIEERNNNTFRLVSPRDAHGHGDMASAFGYAILGANELAGRKPVRAGAVFESMGSNNGDITRRLEAAQRYRLLRESEYNDRGPENYDYSGKEEWKTFMRLVGRR